MTQARLAEYARELLLQRMCHYSEECYCAGWMTGNEATLWEIATTNRRQYGPVALTDDDARELRQLGEDAGGWWVYSDIGQGWKFVTLPAWRRIYVEKWGG